MTDRKKAIVTGASSGIGRATAIRFAREGWDVGITARRQSLLMALMDEFPGGDHFLVAGDYSAPETAELIGNKIDEKWGRLDALINNAGAFSFVKVIDSPLEVWRQNLETMVFGGVLMTRMAVGWMVNGGRIIHVTSIDGTRAESGACSYSMAKAALNQYCRALALELASQGILVNAIAPGFISTPMSVVNGVNELESDWFKHDYVEGHHLPLKRPGQPEEVAGVAFFLAGPDATYITGQVITVDGGLTITF